MSATIRAALVDATGAVVNVAVIDPAVPWEPPAGQTPYHLPDTSNVGIGWKREGDTFVPPAPEPAVALPTTFDLDARSRDQQAQIDALMDLMLGS